MVSSLPPGKYRLYAYVAAGSVFHLPHNQPTTSFEWIYQRRPQGHRYAVAGEWDVLKHGDRYLVWDLLNTMVTVQVNQMEAPPPRLVHTDLDAAIAATVLLYGKEASDNL